MIHSFYILYFTTMNDSGEHTHNAVFGCADCLGFLTLISQNFGFNQNMVQRFGYQICNLNFKESFGN